MSKSRWIGRALAAVATASLVACGGGGGSGGGSSGGGGTSPPPVPIGKTEAFRAYGRPLVGEMPYLERLWAPVVTL
jgi:hypothetical protein